MILVLFDATTGKLVVLTGLVEENEECFDVGAGDKGADGGTCCVMYLRIVRTDGFGWNGRVGFMGHGHRERLECRRECVELGLVQMGY